MIGVEGTNIGKKGMQTIPEAELINKAISRPRDGVGVMWNSPMLYRVNH